MKNLWIETRPIEGADYPPETFDLILCIHVLYTLPEPRQSVTLLFDWLRPGGYVVACDIGRVLKLRDWAMYLFLVNRRKRGLVSALNLFWKGRMVARENREIARRQQSGAVLEPRFA